MDENSDVIVLGNVTYHLSSLSEDEKMRIQHFKFHEEHKGHEKMHMEMFMVALLSLLICQTILMLWKNLHFRTYQLVTLIGMWIVPFIYSVISTFPRFIFIWTLFSLITGTMIFLCSKKRINSTTPRRIYKWFLMVHNITYTLGIVGCILIILTLLLMNSILLLSSDLTLNAGLLLIFYGLYYGVISRDFAEVCTDKMAAQISYSCLPSKRLNPTICYLCTSDLISDNGEKTHRLNCSHVFHDFCIRGWCIIGKKDICPYCKEKVNLKQTFSNPWDQPQLMYGNFLDWVRYMVAWQPVILGIIQAINMALGLK